MIFSVSTVSAENRKIEAKKAIRRGARKRRQRSRLALDNEIPIRTLITLGNENLLFSE